MSNICYSLPVSNFSCLHMCEWSICFEIIKYPRSQLKIVSVHCLPSRVKEILDCRHFLAAWYSREREKKCSEAFVWCYGTFLNAGICRLGKNFLLSITNFLVCTVCTRTITVWVSFPVAELWIQICHFKMDEWQGRVLLFAFPLYSPVYSSYCKVVSKERVTSLWFK